MYNAIVLGINSGDLENWANEVVTERANVYMREKELKKQQKGKGFFSRVFGGKEVEKSEQEKQE